MSFMVAIVAAIEVILFSFLGNVIDWLSEADKATFLEQEGDTLIFFGVVVLLVLPIMTLLLSMVSHQTIIDNYPMRIRWQAHRYLLRQSFGFLSG